MKRLLALAAALLLVVALSGCEEKPLAPGVIKEVGNVEMKTAPVYDWTAVVTKGGHSYLPVNLRMKMRDVGPFVLNVLDEFEKAHQDLEVARWQPFTSNHSGSIEYDILIIGIYIDHRLKLK